MADMRRFQRQMRQLQEVDLHDLLDVIGAEVVDQTKLRIQEEKRAPDGTDWSPWSPRYAASQHGGRASHGPHPGQLTAAGGHTILELDGFLLDSITSEVSGSDVLIGSNLEYAATHQFGRGPIPARPFLGLSDQNADDIENLVAEFLGDVLIAGRSR
jgi:phage virion morphogenesis protein